MAEADAELQAWLDANKNKSPDKFAAELFGKRGVDTLISDNPHEDAMALSFCEAHRGLRYVAGWGRWMICDDQCWRADDTLAVYDLIRQHVRRSTTEDTKGQQLRRAQSIHAIQTLARTDRRYAATVDQWDAGDWLLNTIGGVIDLRTGIMRPHVAEEYHTKIATTAPDGDCPMWKHFLLEITGGDHEYVEFLQRVFGYAITGSTREHALFFLYGPGGNGKGTFLNTAHRILGDYAAVAPMETFTETKGDRHPADLAMLRGARVVFAQETEEGRCWAESKIKSLTGGDPITARFMRQDFFTFTPKFKLLIAGNHKPSLRNVDAAIRRRLHLLPFMLEIPKEKRDPDLADKLLTQEAGGILKWMIDGCLAYQEHGLRPPQVVADATSEYFATENVFEQWLEECCERGPGYWETPARLFGSWKKYAEAANERADTQKQLAARLSIIGFKDDRGRPYGGGRAWIGLRLKPMENDNENHWQD